MKDEKLISEPQTELPQPHELEISDEGPHKPDLGNSISDEGFRNLIALFKLLRVLTNTLED